MAAKKRGEEDLFFPPKGRSDLVKKAKAICASCPVKAECEDWAVKNGDNHGIWAGKNRQTGN